MKWVLVAIVLAGCTGPAPELVAEELGPCDSRPGTVTMFVNDTQNETQPWDTWVMVAQHGPSHLDPLVGDWCLQVPRSSETYTKLHVRSTTWGCATDARLQVEAGTDSVVESVDTSRVCYDY